jgi:hypothetical protein
VTLFAIRKNIGVTQHGFVPVLRKPITTKLDLTTLGDLVSGVTFYLSAKRKVQAGSNSADQGFVENRSNIT